MKNTFQKIGFLIILLSSACNTGDLDRINFIEVSTLPVENIDLVSATLSGEVKGIAQAIEQHGFVWSTSNDEPSFAINEGRVVLGAKDVDGLFSAEAINLEKDQQYFVRSFALNNNQESYGSTVSFMTNDITLTTDSLVYIKRRVASVYGTLQGINSNIAINQIGVVWSSTNMEPIIDGTDPDQFISLGEPTDDGSFSGEIRDLETETNYYYRTYAILNFGNEVIYGSTQLWEANLVDIWTRKSDAPTEVNTGWGHVIDGAGYILDQHKMLKYNFATDDWETKPELTEPVLTHSASFSVGTNIYQIGGKINGELSAKIYKYDTVIDEWSVLPDEFPGGPRELPIAFSIDGIGYYGLGYSGLPEMDFRETDLWKFEEPNGWTELPVTNPDYPETPYYFDLLAHTDGVRGFLVGDGVTGLFWMYEPATNTWSKKADYPAGLSNRMASFYIENQLHVVTGVGLGQLGTQEGWRYNRSEDVWEEIAPLPGEARRAAMSFSYGDKGYVIGGINAISFLKDIWEYTPFEN